MSSLKRISPWIACLAILLNMFAMPLSRAMQTPDMRLMLLGGFCSGGGSGALPQELGKMLDALQMPQSKPVMQHGDCCCGHAGLQHCPLVTIGIFCRNTHPIPPSTILSCQRGIQGFVGPA